MARYFGRFWATLWDRGARGVASFAAADRTTYFQSLGTVKASEARAAALAFLAGEKGGGKPLPPSSLRLDAGKVAAVYVNRRSPAWKPSAWDFNVSNLANGVLPALGQLRVGAVACADVTRFFQEYGRKRPGGANRCHEILRTMFDCAITWGHRPESAGNPCAQIDRYRLPLRDADDLAKLGAILRRLEAGSLTCVAVVWVILLTGYGPGEIRRLRGGRR